MQPERHADASHNLGAMELAAGRVDASLPFFKAALEAAPHEARYWLSYIGALLQAGQYDDARLVLSYGRDAGLSGPDVETLAAALDSRGAPPQSDSPPSSVEEELGNLFAGQRYDEMEQKILDALRDFPRWLVGWQTLSDVYLIRGKDARPSAQRALALNPGDAKEHCYYGLVLKKQGDLKGAASAFSQAITLKPDYAAAYNNLGIVEKDMGDVEAGLSHFRKALQLSPQYADCFSNMLFCLSHSEKVDLATLLAEHRRFGEQFETRFQALWHKHANDRNPARCLKVGFVSADFREHSLANFFEPVLGHLSHAPGLALHAYSVSSIADEVTRRLREKFQHWHDVERLSNEALADQIRADRIDILVDLSGHTSGNRLLTFAMKPAPIQVSWLGYLFTTGMSAMDYYLADSFLLPPGKFDRQFTEKLVQLPANAPFVPSEAAPEVNALPALKNAYLTFACFNRPNKITAAVVALWAKLLRALPDSRMLLGGMPQEGSYDTLIEWFAREGITRERLIFHPRSSMENYLKLHHE
ncbi:MAG TPA: tetratricopeptide repeat protein, partial [Gallionella sp.]|nr:tetratricopeptide repeat protein [Gallionella sp.]